METERPIPYGFPIAKTLSPTFKTSESPKTIGFKSSSGDIFKTAMSVFLSKPIMESPFKSTLNVFSIKYASIWVSE